jgi:hypothetical protein
MRRERGPEIGDLLPQDPARRSSSAPPSGHWDRDDEPTERIRQVIPRGVFAYRKVRARLQRDHQLFPGKHLVLRLMRMEQYSLHTNVEERCQNR